ncbi:MAG: hypothetical protein ISS81_04835 [Candidatus Marinimicrobia bacterium]|nr:hypothetical protein [Candidatus Neomarinimicrobiota bacterium]
MRRKKVKVESDVAAGFVPKGFLWSGKGNSIKPRIIRQLFVSSRILKPDVYDT